METFIHAAQLELYVNRNVSLPGSCVDTYVVELGRQMTRDLNAGLRVARPLGELNIVHDTNTQVRENVEYVLKLKI